MGQGVALAFVNLNETTSVNIILQVDPRLLHNLQEAWPSSASQTRTAEREASADTSKRSLMASKLGVLGQRAEGLHDSKNEVEEQEKKGEDLVVWRVILPPKSGRLFVKRIAEGADGDAATASEKAETHAVAAAKRDEVSLHDILKNANIRIEKTTKSEEQQEELYFV